MAGKSLHDDQNTLTVEEEKEEFISFIIGNETFGVDVLKVHEIIGMTDITPVPDSVHYMKGVINLRGNVVPVVDMRLRFNMEVIEYTQVTVIIIVEVNDRYVGMIVDTVSDVVGIPMSNIHESSSLSSDMEINSEFIQAIGQIDSQLIIILDVTRILESESVSR